MVVEIAQLVKFLVLYTFATQTQTQGSKIDKGAYFVSKTVIIPHDDKKDRGGEDAASVCDTLLTVADGVGGWNNQGINPGLFSAELTSQIVEKYEQAPSLNMKELVEYARESAARKFQGSATSTTIRIVSADKVEGLNIGDSGYSQWRYTPATEPITEEDHQSRLELLFESEVGQKQFNFPFQIGSVGDDPREVGQGEFHDYQDKDIFVLYTDGVTDNIIVDKAAFRKCITKYTELSGLIGSHSGMADCLARKAYHLGKRMDYDSPFTRGARASGMPQFMNMRGGKHDDITVTVAQIFLNPISGETREDNRNADTYIEEKVFKYTGDVGRVLDIPAIQQDFATPDL